MADVTLTPADVERELWKIAERIDKGRDILIDLDRRHTHAQSAFDLAMARALLRATGPNAEARKAQATEACKAERDELDVASIALRSARGRMDDLKVRADIIRSIGTSVRESMK